jgi:hypothetical protein
MSCVVVFRDFFFLLLALVIGKKSLGKERLGLATGATGNNNRVFQSPHSLSLLIPGTLSTLPTVTLLQVKPLGGSTITLSHSSSLSETLQMLMDNSAAEAAS